MLGSEVILFPEGGGGFIRTLRTAILYSEKVRVLAVGPPEILDYDVNDLCRTSKSPLWTKQRLENYLASLKESQPELNLLAREGLISPILFGSDPKKASVELAANRLMETIKKGVRGEEEPLKLVNAIIPAFNSDLPCFSDADYLSYLANVATLATRKWLDETVGHDDAMYLYFVRYLVQVAAASEQLGIAVCSWSPDFHNAMLAARQIYAEPNAKSDGIPSGSDRVAFGLAHQILERRLPRADDLPLQELLRIRHKRAEELESFRVALRAVVAEINPEDTPDHIRAATERLIITKIDPAVDELRRAVRASRIDAFRGIGRSSASLAGAVVSASLTLATGAPVNFAALLAAAGGLIGSAIDAALNRERIINASQWGLLLRLR